MFLWRGVEGGADRVGKDSGELRLTQASGAGKGLRGLSGVGGGGGGGAFLPAKWYERLLSALSQRCVFSTARGMRKHQRACLLQ